MHSTHGKHQAFDRTQYILRGNIPQKVYDGFAVDANIVLFSIYDTNKFYMERIEAAKAKYSEQGYTNLSIEREAA